MQHMRGTFLVLMITLLPLLASCGSNSTSSGNSGSTSPCDKQSSIRGITATVVSAPAGAAAGYIGAILIDGTKEKQAQFDKVYASIYTNSQIFEKQGANCRSTSFSALKVGQRVQVQSTGIVQQSYPPQINATEIVILSTKA